MKMKNGRVESKVEFHVWTVGRGKRERKQASAGADITDGEKTRRLPRIERATTERNLCMLLFDE